jgi:hypothetical protein
MNARVADFSLEFPSMGVLSVDEKSIEIERVRENDDVREVRKDRRKRMKPEGFQGEDGTHRSRHYKRTPPTSTHLSVSKWRFERC